MVGLERLAIPPQQLHPHAERRQRGTKLVRQRRHQVLAPALLIAQVGDVLQGQDEPGRGAGAGVEGRRPEHVVMVAAAEEEGDLDAIALALGMRLQVAHRLAQPEVVGMRRGEIVEARPQHDLALDLEDGAGDLVHVRDAAAGLEHDQAVLARLDDGLGLRLRLEHDVDAGALDRDCDLVGEGVEELALVEREAGAGRPQPEHADHAARGFDGDVEPFAAGQRLCARAGGLVVIQHPGGGRHLGVAEHRVGLGGADLEPARDLGEDDGGAFEESAQAANHDREQIVQSHRTGNLTGEGVERGRMLLAVPCQSGLIAGPGGQSTGQDRDREEDEERHDVLRVGDREREDRLDEQEIVHDQAQERRGDGRPEAGAHRHQQHAGHEDHGRIEETDRPLEERGDGRRARHDRQRERVAPPRRRGPASLRRRSARAPGVGLAGDEPHRDVAALVDHVGNRRG